MGYTKEQFDKLPKWAKSKITVLEMHNASLREKVAQIKGESETNTFIADGLERRPLPKNSSIEFSTGRNGFNRVSVRVHSTGVIDVNCNSRIGQDMVIRPLASNAFYIDFVD